MTSSVNQVRHLYVVNTADDFKVGKNKEGFWFELKDADGNAVRSDLITNVMYAKATSATAMQRKLKTIKITAADADMVAGQDYIVRIAYRKFVSQSGEDTYQEFGAARAAKTGDNVEDVLKELAINLAKNTKKQEMVEIKALVGGTETAIEDLTDASTVAGIIIREIEQPWTLGTRQVEAVDFTVTASTVLVGGVETAWATIEDITADEETAIGNGKKIADLEYFCLGDRGDVYRNMGWPNVIPTAYMADPTKQYDVIDIHYAYVGANHAIQKSEKDITLVMPAGEDGTTHTIANAVIEEINAEDVIDINEITDEEE